MQGVTSDAQLQCTTRISRALPLVENCLNKMLFLTKFSVLLWLSCIDTSNVYLVTEKLKSRGRVYLALLFKVSKFLERLANLWIQIANPYLSDKASMLYYA